MRDGGKGHAGRRRSPNGLRRYSPHTLVIGILIALIALAGSPVHAQTSAVFVSNTGQTSIAQANSGILAIAIETGPNPTGYVLEKVEILAGNTIAAADLATTDPLVTLNFQKSKFDRDLFEVVLVPDQAGEVDVELENPTSITSGQPAVFTVPEGRGVISHNDIWWIVINDEGIAEADRIAVQMTASTAEDADSQQGWSIDDVARIPETVNDMDRNTKWEPETNGYVIQVKLTGYARPDTTLESLVVTDHRGDALVLDPEFRPHVSEGSFALNVRSVVESITVAVNPSDPDATLEFIIGDVDPNDPNVITKELGSPGTTNTLLFRLTAGGNTVTYIIAVKRAETPEAPVPIEECPLRNAWCAAVIVDVQSNLAPTMFEGVINDDLPLSGIERFGYNDVAHDVQSEYYGEISSSAFSFDGVGYVVGSVFRSKFISHSEGIGGTVETFILDDIVIATKPRLPDDWIFYVGEYRFFVSEAEKDHGAYSTYQWDTPSDAVFPEFTKDDRVVVALEQSPPLLTLSDSWAREGRAITFMATLDAPAATNYPVSFRYYTSVEDDDTAGEAGYGPEFEAVGTDPGALPGTVFGAERIIFSEGQTIVSFTIPTTDDTRYEVDETFTVNLTHSPGAELGVVRFASTKAKGTIQNDDDPPVVTLSVGESAKTEDDLVVYADVNVVVTGETEEVVTVHTAIESAGGFPATPGEDFVLPDECTGNMCTTTIDTSMYDDHIIPFWFIDDTIDEEDEQFRVSIVDVIHATFSRVDDPPTHFLDFTIVDNDDPPTVDIDDNHVIEGSDLQIPVRLSSASGKPIIIEYTVAGVTADKGDDYVEPTGTPQATDPTTVTIPPGDTTATIHIETIADGVDEVPDGETLTVTISNTLSPTSVTLGDDVAIGTIFDTAPIAAVSGLAASVAQNGGSVTFGWGTAEAHAEAAEPTGFEYCYKALGAAGCENDTEDWTEVPDGGTSLRIDGASAGLINNAKYTMAVRSFSAQIPGSDFTKDTITFTYQHKTRPC